MFLMKYESELLGRSRSGIPLLSCCHRNPTSGKCKQIDGWLNYDVMQAAHLHTLLKYQEYMDPGETNRGAGVFFLRVSAGLNRMNLR